jgi:uncharacterized protein YndB with AHSA1/START domain
MEIRYMPAANLQLKNIPVVETGMLIRRPVNEVFNAFADPAITTRFWFTKSTGKLAPGAEVEWTWEMYGVTTPVRVKEFEQDRRIVNEWGAQPAATTFELDFSPRNDGTTYVSVTESGFSGETGDDIVAWAIGSMGGFTQALAAAKALLEYQIAVPIVADRFPDGHPG